MTITIAQLVLYSGALFILFITPGPVWVAIIARTVSGGFKSAVPLAFGVAFGDIIWPLIALVGVSYLALIYADILVLFRYIAAVILCLMGTALLRWPNKILNEDEMKILDTWLLDYYTWVKTNYMGTENDNGLQN
ncbi:MAG: LysE family transporter, partial [Amylibacter sp.]